MTVQDVAIDSSEKFYAAIDDPEQNEPTGKSTVTEGGDVSDSVTAVDGDQAGHESGELGKPVDDDSQDAKSDENATDDSSDTSAEEEPVYLELDGKEVDLNEVRAWRDGHLMQSDYTRKTTDLADQRKDFEAKDKELSAELTSVATLKTELQALIDDDSNADLDRLRESDPDEYIRLTDRATRVKEAIAKVKSKPSTPSLSSDEQMAEHEALMSANPEWLDKDGELTKQMTDDQALVEKYWKDNDFTESEISGMSRSRHVMACLKAAKFDKLQAKASALGKKAKAAPLVTKPSKLAAKTKQKQSHELFYKPVTE